MVRSRSPSTPTPNPPDLSLSLSLSLSISIFLFFSFLLLKLPPPDLKDTHFRQSFEQTDATVRAFSSTLPRTLNAQGGLSHGLFMPHSFALAAIIQLHWIVAAEHNHLHPSYQHCLNAAIDMVSIIDVIQMEDYALLELHIGVRPPPSPFLLLSIRYGSTDRYETSPPSIFKLDLLEVDR